MSSCCYQLRQTRAHWNCCHSTQQGRWSTASSSSALTAVTVCWLTVHSVLWIGSSGWWMRHGDLSVILVGWHLYPVCCGLAARAWTSPLQALSSSLWSCPWHCTKLSQWTLSIKRWRHCSFSSLLGSTRRSPSSTFEDPLWWWCVCSQQHGTDYKQQSIYMTLCRIWRTNFKFFWWTFFCLFPFISNAGAYKLMLYYYFFMPIGVKRLSLNCHYCKMPKVLHYL